MALSRQHLSTGACCSRLSSPLVPSQGRTSIQRSHSRTRFSAEPRGSTCPSTFRSANPWRHLDVAAARMSVAGVQAASQYMRCGSAQVFSRFIATFGLLAVIWGCVRADPPPCRSPWEPTSRQHTGLPRPHRSRTLPVAARGNEHVRRHPARRRSRIHRGSVNRGHGRDRIVRLAYPI